MKQALIVGAGGLGREVLGWLEDVRNADGRFDIGGFLTNSGESQVEGLPVVGDPAEFEPQPNHLLVCAIGSPSGKLRVAERLTERGGRWLTLIHPSARIGRGSEVGEGSLLCPGAVITTQVELLRFVVLNIYATVGHDAKVGEGSTLSSHCDVTGRVTLGRGVFMGSHAVAAPGIRVGDFATIGAGSVATRNVPRGCTVFGMPAKRVWGPPD